MYTETALFDLLLPGDSQSLKQKRSYVRPIIAMLRKFEVSVAEVGAARPARPGPDRGGRGRRRAGPGPGGDRHLREPDGRPARDRAALGEAPAIRRRRLSRLTARTFGAGRMGRLQGWAGLVQPRRQGCRRWAICRTRPRRVGTRSASGAGGLAGARDQGSPARHGDDHGRPDHRRPARGHVYYTVLGDATEQAATAAALESAKGMLRTRVGHALGPAALAEPDVRAGQRAGPRQGDRRPAGRGPAPRRGGAAAGRRQAVRRRPRPVQGRDDDEDEDADERVGAEEKR